MKLIPSSATDEICAWPPNTAGKPTSREFPAWKVRTANSLHWEYEFKELSESCSEALDAFNDARGSARPDSRFYQLVDIAREGGADAVADLWHEYQFQFGDEPASPSRSHAEHDQ